MYAVRNGYDIVVQVDGDGQHSPEWIPAILDPILTDEADCVVGSRYVPECPDCDYKTPFARRIGMYFSTGILALFTGLRINDTTSGFRALNRKALTFFSMEYPVDHPEAEALLLLHQMGFRIKEVPVKMRGRVAGQSLFTITKAAMYPLRVIIGFMGLVFKRPERRKI
jgi:glycosyltransferase involved in cell wall biosynthesis